MKNDSLELATGSAGVTGHCETTTPTATETTSPHLRELHDGYYASRFNALRHGVLSVHTVLPLEDKAEFEALLNAIVDQLKALLGLAAQGPIMFGVLSRDPPSNPSRRIQAG